MEKKTSHQVNLPHSLVPMAIMGTMATLQHKAPTNIQARNLVSIIIHMDKEISINIRAGNILKEDTAGTISGGHMVGVIAIKLSLYLRLSFFFHCFFKHTAYVM